VWVEIVVEVNAVVPPGPRGEGERLPLPSGTLSCGTSGLQRGYNGADVLPVAEVNQMVLDVIYLLDQVVPEGTPAFPAEPVLQ
jgi:hypothetical protein